MCSKDPYCPKRPGNKGRAADLTPRVARLGERGAFGRFQSGLVERRREKMRGSGNEASLCRVLLKNKGFFIQKSKGFGVNTRFFLVWGALGCRY